MQTLLCETVFATFELRQRGCRPYSFNPIAADYAEQQWLARYDRGG
jgi:hypothetical protein